MHPYKFGTLFVLAFLKCINWLVELYEIKVDLDAALAIAAASFFVL